MSNTSIKVKPSGLPGAVDVALTTFDEQAFPLYKIVYSLEGSEPIDVSESTPFPVSLFSSGEEAGSLSSPFAVRNVSNSEMDTKAQLSTIIYLLETIADINHGETIAQFRS